MILGDYHVHTSFCDGTASPAEMAAAAFRQGLSALGFSGHSHTAFDGSWCMSSAGTAAYRAEVSRLREAYAGRMKVLCGVEQDYYSEEPTQGYDYVIGSVHYLRAKGEYSRWTNPPTTRGGRRKRISAGTFWPLRKPISTR